MKRSTRFVFSQPKHSLVLCYSEKLIEYLLTVLQVFLLPDYCTLGEPDKMPHARISGSVHSPTVGVMIDMGNPLLNRTVDGFLKIGTVGASRVIAEETYGALSKGSVSKHDLEHTLKKMGKEGLKWGAVAGVYTGIEYGVERIRGRRDWTNALISGAVTGAAMSFSDKHYSRDKMIKDAITGGAIATAAEFIRYLT